MTAISISPATLLVEILLWTLLSPGVWGGGDTEVHLLSSASCLLFNKVGVLRGGMGLLKVFSSLSEAAHVI